MTQVRKFVLSSPGVSSRCWEFIKALRADLEGTGRVIQIVVAEYAPNQRAGQRKHYWGYVLEPAARQAPLDGHYTDAQGWHMLMKWLHLPETCAAGIDKWTFTDEGRELQMSTTHLNDREFDEYIERVAAYLSTDHNVELPAWDPDQP